MNNKEKVINLLKETGKDSFLERFRDNEVPYKFFFDSRSHLIDIYSFRLERAKEKNMNIKDLESFVNNLENYKEETLRVNKFISNEEEFYILTNKSITKLIDIMPPYVDAI